MKNTFIDTDLGRSLSIDGFFEERQWRSCPSSALYASPDAVMTEKAAEDFQAPAEPPAAPVPASEPAAPVLPLSDALQAAELGTPALPSVGSSDHCLGTCKPCAHAHSAKGCWNGVQCGFCHLCPPRELKRQQKAKRVAQRRADSA